MFYEMANVLINGLLYVLTTTQVRGKEHFPLHGPFVLASNHIHFLDPPVIGASMPRTIYFMAKTELYANPFAGLIMKWYKAFPVRRGELDLGSFRRAERILRDGGVLGIFPEGTRSKDGQLQPGFAGLGLLAIRRGCPVLPLAISGTNQVLKFPAMLRRPTISITVGKPLWFGEATPKPSRERLSAATTQIMEAIAGLLPLEQRGVYSDFSNSHQIPSVPDN
jgi:1-acyl-sn-glycerol-3-phosphate acyltransferase